MIFPKALRRSLATGLLGSLLLMCADAALARGDAAVWVLKGKHNTVYLAGSVHALPKDHAELPEQLERAYGASKAIVMEVDMDDLDPMDAVRFITEKGTLKGDATLATVIGEDNYAKVSALCASLGVPNALIDKLEPWAASLVLTQFALAKSGFDPSLGIDVQITARAKTDHKPIEGLESVVDQLSIFDGRSLEEQTGFLVDAAKDASTLDADLARLIDAWRTGDLRELEKEFVKERAEDPALYDALLGARNRKWIPQIEKLLDADDDYLVVVGALHYVGRDGLLQLLKNDGHKAVPMRAAH